MAKSSSFKNFAKKNKNLKYGGYMTIIIIFAIIAVIVANLLFQRLKLTVDLTQEKLYTIGSRTQVLLDRVEDDVTIYGLYMSGSENTDVIALIEDYIKHCSKVSFKAVDPYKNPEFTAPYKDDTETIANNSLIVVNERTNKFKIVSQTDLYDYSQTVNYETYNYDYKITAFKAEEALTSAIQYVTSENTPILYAMTGHGETELNSTVQSSLKKSNYDVQSYNLMSDEPLEGNSYTILLINNPVQDLTEYEYQFLLTYMDHGGRLILNLSSNYPENMAYFDKFLERYGVQVEKGLVVDLDQNYYVRGSNPAYMLPEVLSHDITEEVNNHNVIVPYSVGLKIMDDRNRNTDITEILKTSNSSIVKKDLSKQELLPDFEEGDVRGPVDVGLLVEETKAEDGKVYYAKIAVYGSSYIFDPNFMTGSNFNLLIGSLDHLQGSIQSLYIESKTYATTDLVLTTGQLVTWSIVFVVGIPLGVLIIGLVIWSRRKRL
ncbi:MAG: GldG family protein [Clostridiales bacterium]|nr:GldG family protein [Clostridiales bacterium]